MRAASPDSDGPQSSRTPLLRTRTLSDQMTDSGGAEPEVVVPASGPVEGGKEPRHVDWLQFARTLHLELFLFVYAMSYSMRLVMTQDLFLSKACLLRYGINASACRNLSANSTVKDDVTRCGRRQLASMGEACWHVP